MKPNPLAYLGLFSLATAFAGAAENPWTAFRFAPDALEEVDLSSDTAWTLRIDGGPPRPVKVTAGGWNSDRQDPPVPSPAVRDHVVYERKLQIPPGARGRAVKVLFGGCNYGAEVYLDDRKVVEHHAPMTPFVADLTGLVGDGEHVLRVKAFTRTHYGVPPNVPVGFDFNRDVPGVPADFNGQTRFAYGLIGHVRLAVYPLVHIVDVFVRSSVADQALACDVWIANAGTQERTVSLKGVLAPWNNRSWKYPALPERTVRIAAGTTRHLGIDDIRWDLGPASYWWPNIPFREDYSPTLHLLNLTLEEDGQPLHHRRQRFGFVEYREGAYYYTVNGVRFTSVSDSNSYGQVGEYDCWTETACFQPPHGGFKGCPETWRRYQRIGFNSMRLSTSVPTAYMLQTADEAGYMLIPEGGSWGNGTSRFHTENFSRQLQATIRAVRAHPCVARYSLANESLPADFESPGCLWRQLIDAALEVDSTRPYVFEVNNGRTGAVGGMKGGHAHQMEHYTPILEGGDHIRGMGEFAWTTDGMGEYAMGAVRLRLNDYAHFAPWSWLNFWPNFLEGMSAGRHPWHSNNYGDRHDQVDGWDSPIVRAVQRSIHPFLVVDTDLLAMNPRITETSKDRRVRWPYRLPVYTPGEVAERRVEVFNGGLDAAPFALRWTGRWDEPDGPVALDTQTTAPSRIEAGFHTSRVIRFQVPLPDRECRDLCLIVESLRDDRSVYREDRIRFTVSRAGGTSSAVLVGTDEETGGNWPGHYGAEGYALAGRPASISGGVQLTWLTAEEWTWQASTDDRRAPIDPAVPPGGKGRFAACRYGDTVSFALDLGEKSRSLSLYLVDWDKAGRKMLVRISDAETGKDLDTQSVATFGQGRWLTWSVRGRIRVEITCVVGKNAVLQGLFLDPAK